MVICYIWGLAGSFSHFRRSHQLWPHPRGFGIAKTVHIHRTELCTSVFTLKVQTNSLIFMSSKLVLSEYLDAEIHSLL